MTLEDNEAKARIYMNLQCGYPKMAIESKIMNFDKKNT